MLAESRLEHRACDVQSLFYHGGQGFFQPLAPLATGEEANDGRSYCCATIAPLYNAQCMTFARYVLAIVVTVVGISVIVGLQSPGDEPIPEPGCRLVWLGVLPIDLVCATP